MPYSKLIINFALLFSVLAALRGQEPTAVAGHQSRSEGTQLTNTAAISGSKQDPAAVERGSSVFLKNCAGCHGVAGKGGPGAPDLLRSLLVLDDEKGILIAPVIREGRPDKGMPKLGLPEQQIADVVAWLHVQTYAVGHRGTYTFQNVVTGDSKKGEIFFNTRGQCSTCHSITSDLAGIGGKYDAFSLQSRWLQPRNPRGGRGGAGEASKAVMTVTVILPSGESLSGPLDRIDDFTVSFHDSHGEFHSFARDAASPPRVEIHDPLKLHNDMLRTLTDADIHNMTAYLVTLK